MTLEQNAALSFIRQQAADSQSLVWAEHVRVLEGMARDAELKKGIGTVLSGLAASADAELFGKTQDQLEEYWYFKWDASASVASNLYSFHDLLGLYGRQCRRWEEKHNGHVCVVERVRDKYLMPKIRAFVAALPAEQEKEK